jgi:hypothetical protein
MSMIESLEMRKLMAATVSGSTLTVNGTSGNDQLVVRENNGAVHVEVNGTITDYTGITAININGLNGGDNIFFTGNSVGANIHGDSGGGKTGGSHGSGSGSGGTAGGTGRGSGAGADFIVVTDEGTGASIVDGDGGNDDITIVAGNMTGKVTRVYGGDGDDNIQLNTDNHVNYNTLNARIEAFAEKGNDSITVYDGFATVHGNQGKDILFRQMDATVVYDGFETVVVLPGT